MRLFDIFKAKPKPNIALNTAVFTTKNVINENALITRIYHGSDNALQFFDDNSTNSNANIMLVSLGEIIDKDNSVTEAVNMASGNFASRKAKKDKWSIEPYVEVEE